MNNAPQADLAIAVQQLGFSYPGSGKPALSGISMTVRRGSCLGLLGPNGAGKSTLLSLLTGILPRQSGEIHLFGKPLTGDRALRRGFALVPQDYAFYPTLRVRQNLECFAGLYGLRGAHKRERIDEVVAMCRLESVFNQCAAACSGGVRRRLNLAIGLLNQPRLLYLDEPTVGIDAQSRHFILASIKRLREAGMTVVYTSHYMDEVQALCDELVIVDEGRILLQDTLANMPVLFILIMGLALQEPLSRHDQPKKILALLSADSAGPQTSPVMALLQQQTAFTWQVVGRQDATERISRDEAAFLLSLREQYGAVQADILVAPGTNRLTEALFTTTVTAVLGRQQMDALLQGMHIGNGQPADPVRVHYRYASEQGGKRPTSVQQSVPAWLVFAMFFSVVPLANTLISERQQGTLRRIGTLPVSPYLPVMGKFIPYFLINQIQVLLMLAVGIYLMPALGADRLTPGDSYSALALMATSLSVAALGYGLLIAVLARTTDQAATLGGIGNILLAAIGGVMVPRFVMPETMQTIAGFSPMAWGMEGLLDLFLRNGQVADVLPEAGALLLFGGVGLVLAIVLSRHRY